MSLTDTATAKKYASIAEIAAAQAKLSAEKLENAPDYADQAAASALAAAASAQVAVSAESVVNNLATAASESATQAAASAAEAGNAAAAQIGRTVRSPDGESLSELPPAEDRQSSVVYFNENGDATIKQITDFATLDSSGKIPVSVIPSIALTQPFVVSTQAGMLALDAQPGDIAKRTDLGYSFCLAVSPASSLSNWIQLTDDVLAQLGQSSGAAAIGAVDDSSAPSTVQALLTAKANKSTLTAQTGAAYIGALNSSGAASNVQAALGQKANSADLSASTGLTAIGFGQSTAFGASTRTFEYFGAVGDGTTDDTAAIQSAAAWVVGGNNRYLTTESGKVAYRLTSTVNFNFANGRGHAILMKSPIRPDAGTGTAFLIQNTRDSQFELRVDGGGDALVDYTQADPVGAQQAFLIRGCRNCRAEIVGVNYSGRVLRVMGLDATSGGILKQSFFYLDIRTGDSTAVSPGRCGQGFYIQGDNSAWGKIGTAFINWDQYGSVVEKVADITIDHCEFGANGASGFEFRGVASCHIGNMAGGDETFTNTVLLFRPADDGTQCIGVNIKRIFVLQGKIGVEFRGSNGANSGTNPNFTVEDIYSQGNTQYGILINGCNNSRIKSATLFSNGINVFFTRTNRNVRFDADCLSSTQSGISCDSTANLDEIYITGRVFGNSGAPAVDLSVATSVGHVVFNDHQVTSGNGAYHLPVSNLAEIRGGRVSFTSGGMYNNGIAKAVQNVSGFTTRSRGAGSIAIGNQTTTITHGLAQTPTEYTITPLSTAGTFRVLNVGSTTFDVQLSSVVSGTAWTFNWVASCEYH